MGNLFFFTIWGEIHFTKTTKSSQKYTLKSMHFAQKWKNWTHIHNNTEKILSDTSKFSSPKHLLTNWEERNFYRSLNTFEYRGSNQNKPNADQNIYSCEYNTPSSLHEFQKLSNNIENLKNEAFLYLIIILTAINLC